MSGVIGGSGSKSGIIGHGRFAIGEVVQKMAVVSSHRQQTTNADATAFNEPNTAYRVTIVPKFSNSRIDIDYSIPFNQNSATNIITLFRFFRLISGGSKAYNITSQGNTSHGDRHAIAGSSFRPQGYDAQDSCVYHQSAVDFPSTTTSTVYGFETKPQGTNTTTWGYSGGNSSNWGWNADIVITATEIRQ